VECPTSVGVQVPGLLLIPQRVENYRPPVWPGASIVHLDLTAGEHLNEPVKQAISLGAISAEPQPDPRWKVLLDPAGHSFCITTLAPPPELLGREHRKLIRQRNDSGRSRSKRSHSSGTSWWSIGRGGYPQCHRTAQSGRSHRTVMPPIRP
jgi:hypothetical protein